MCTTCIRYARASTGFGGADVDADKTSGVHKGTLYSRTSNKEEGIDQAQSKPKKSNSRTHFAVKLMRHTQLCVWEDVELSHRDRMDKIWLKERFDSASVDKVVSEVECSEDKYGLPLERLSDS